MKLFPILSCLIFLISCENQFPQDEGGFSATSSHAPTKPVSSFLSANGDTITASALDEFVEEQMVATMAIFSPV